MPTPAGMASRPRPNDEIGRGCPRVSLRVLRHLPTPRGFLFDLDGTLYQDEAPLPGVARAVRVIRDAGLSVRFVTNTSRKPRRQVLEALHAVGIEAELDELFTPTSVAATWLAARGIDRVALCLPSATREDFDRVTIDERAPEAVVVGDLGREWSFDLMNRAFCWLLGGATLVALQKNRYWRAAAGLELDAGPFVAALEYASGVSAAVVGKPSIDFFLVAARSMQLALSHVVMVGDDLENDIGGAQAAGLHGILVRTGKFRQAELDGSEVVPDAVIDSVAELHDAILDVGET